MSERRVERLLPEHLKEVRVPKIPGTTVQCSAVSLGLVHPGPMHNWRVGESGRQLCDVYQPDVGD